MLKINVHEAKTHFSKYLTEVEKGETFLLCRRNEPIAKIVPVKKPIQAKRKFGTLKGKFTIPDSFFDPKTDEEIAQLFLTSELYPSNVPD